MMDISFYNASIFLGDLQEIIAIGILNDSTPNWELINSTVTDEDELEDILKSYYRDGYVAVMLSFSGGKSFFWIADLIEANLIKFIEL